MRSRLLIAALAALSLSACGGGDTGAVVDDGFRALSSGDSSAALAKFQTALGEMQPGDPRYVETKIGELRAQAYGDAKDAEEKPKAAAAVNGFLALAKASTVQAQDYRMLVTDLANASAYGPAVDLLKAGKAAYPEDPKWEALIQKVGDLAKSAGDSSALTGLEGLGYVGDD